MSKTLRELCGKFRLLAICESGQDLVEYGMLTTVIALACITGIQGVADSVNQMFGQVSQAFVTATTSQSGSGGQNGGDGGGHHWGGGGHHWGGY